jgi:hypothetical protein
MRPIHRIVLSVTVFAFIGGGVYWLNFRPTLSNSVPELIVKKEAKESRLSLSESPSSPEKVFTPTDSTTSTSENTPQSIEPGSLNSPSASIPMTVTGKNTVPSVASAPAKISSKPVSLGSSTFTPAQRINNLHLAWQDFNKHEARVPRLQWEKDALEWTRRHAQELGGLGAHYRTTFTLPHPRDASTGVLTPGMTPSPAISDPGLKVFLVDRDQLEAERVKALAAAGASSAARLAAAKAFDAQNADRLKKHRIQAYKLQQVPVEQLELSRYLAQAREKLLAEAFASPSEPSETATSSVPQSLKASSADDTKAPLNLPVLARPDASAIPLITSP